MRDRWLGMALAGGLLAGSVQAVEFDFDLNLPVDGFYSNATEIVTPITYEGATFDLVYTIDSMANGSNSFARSTGAQVGVGSDTDSELHYTTIEGNDGEGLSFTRLSISNYVANGSGYALGDFGGLRFAALTLNNVANSKDGINVSFTGYSTNSVNFTLYGGDVTSTYTLDLTALANYSTTATNLFIKNDSGSSADRWAMVGLGVTLDAPTSGNLLPVADAQNVITLPDMPLEIVLTGTDPEGSNLTYNVVDFPTHGWLAGATNSWVYTPTNGYQGVDQFTFSVNDGVADSELAIVSILVTNELPVATAQTVETLRNIPLDLTLSGSDTDGPSNLVYTVVTAPQNGLLTTNGALPNLTYTPDVGYTGVDQFTFAVYDGLAESSEATVSITVNNNLPVADPKIVFAEPGSTVGVILSGSDVEGSGLTFTVASQPEHGVLGGIEPNITYTPTNGFVGVDHFTYTANDGESDGAAATVTVSVSADGFNLSFEDLNSALSNNTLNVGGISAEVTGVLTNGNDYLYSASFSGVDLDGDGAEDSVTFDVMVEAWSGGEISNSVAAGVVSTNGTAVIGTNNVPVTMAADGWGVTSARLYAGESLEFTVLNVQVSLTDDSKVGTATPTGFVGTYLNEISNANSHQTVIGEGIGLFELTWNENFRYVDGFNTGTEPLIISQANNYIEGHNKAFNWRVQDVDLGINIAISKAGVPDILVDVSGGDLVFSWEGNATYNVLTNADLVYGAWAVAIEGATSPVTNAVGEDMQLFFKLGE